MDETKDKILAVTYILLFKKKYGLDQKIKFDVKECPGFKNVSAQLNVYNEDVSFVLKKMFSLTLMKYLVDSFLNVHTDEKINVQVQFKHYYFVKQI